MSLRLVHFPPARSVRVAWAIHELGLDAEIDTRPFERGSLKQPDYLALNPLGKTPALYDGDKMIVESTAIIEYLANKHGGGKLTRGPDDDDYGDYLQWLHFGEAGMGGYISMFMGHTHVLPEDQRIASMAKWAEIELKNCLAFIESKLEDEGYLLGDFTLADISVAYPLFLLRLTGNAGLFGDKTSAYFKRISNRGGWKKATARK